MKQTIKKYMRNSLLLSAVLGCLTMQPVYADKKDIVIGAAIGGGIGIFAAVVCFSLSALKVRRERKAREANMRKIEQRFRELRAWLERLDGYYSTLPIETLRREADEKMAQVRQMLAQDASAHRQAFSADARQIAHEIATLRTERDRMAAELGRQNGYLQQVQQFLQSVKDHHGESFLYAVVEARRSIEQAIMQLETQRTALSSQLTAIEHAVGRQQHAVHENEQALNALEHSFTHLDASLTERQVQLTSAAESVAQMARDVDHTRRTLQQSTHEHNALRTRLAAALAKLNASVNDIAATGQAAEGQQRKAMQLLQSLRNAANQVKQQVRHVNAVRTIEQDPQPLPTAPPAPAELIAQDPQENAEDPA